MRRDISFFRKALPESEIYIADTSSFLKISDSSLDGVYSIFNSTYCDVFIDSRDVQKGHAFLALNGAKNNGHDFLKDVLEKGVDIIFIDESERGCLLKINENREHDFIAIIVQDTYEALISLAKTWRSYFNYPVIGITGSIGKTTTKEMLRSILKEANIPACISYKNQNTIIGLSINMLRMRDEHKVAVFELGVNEKGEMAQLSETLKPTMALITFIAHSHTKGLGEIEEVAREKRMIFKNLKQDDIGFICGDQQFMLDACYNHPVVKFGQRIKNHIQARKVQAAKDEDGLEVTSFILKMYGQQERVVLKTNHSGAVNNVLGACSLAYFLQVPFKCIVNGVQKFNGFENRFEKRTLKRNKGILISDCYNASPESMRAALLSVHDMQVAGKKIAVLGDMLELGEKETFWHRQIGRLLGKIQSLDSVILVGERAQAIAKTAPINMQLTCVKSWDEAEEQVSKILFETQEHSLVLVKGSLAMQLDKMVTELVE
jgi:UDP-N-acetylmuramoyl-tripeptide--D-alanyl-D-alanine ligase